MNIKHANYVMTVLREGSFSAAANKLFISQPSLSQTIRQLEERLGAPIFDRSRGKPVLTDAGQQYVQAMQQVMMINTNLVNSIAQIKAEPHGRMRLGISVQRCMNLLPQVLPEFMARYPFVKIDLEEHGSHTLEKLVMEGTCDLALVTTNEKANHLEYSLLENEQLVLMAANDTSIARRLPDGAQINIAEARDERFVSLRANHSVRVIQDQLFLSEHIEPEILFETNSLEAAKQIAAHVGAVMICPYVHIVAGSPELLKRVKCFPLRNRYERHFYLCYRKGLYFTRYMEDFVQIVRKHLFSPVHVPEREA